MDQAGRSAPAAVVPLVRTRFGDKAWESSSALSGPCRRLTGHGQGFNRRRPRRARVSAADLFEIRAGCSGALDAESFW